MTKTHKILLCSASAVLVFSIIFGIITRLSYVDVDFEKALTAMYIPNDDEFINEYYSKEEILKQLDQSANIFLVTIKNSKNTYQCTETTAVVDRVLRGNQSLTDKEIIIYEQNFIAYYKENQSLLYHSINPINKLMKINSKYLVFCENMDYTPSYKKTITREEFQIDFHNKIYSFPINKKINYIKNTSKNTLSDLAEYDYFCYSQNQAEHIEEIRAVIFKKLNLTELL